MLKIGDFARLCQVPVKTLRYYDDLGLITPARVDSSTGYRYYSVEQFPRLNRLLALKDLGFSLEQIARVLNEGVTPEQLRGMLKLKRAEAEQRLKEDQGRMARIEARLTDIELEDNTPEYNVLLQTTLSSFPLRRGKVRDIYDLGDKLLLVSTDRISAFDWVVPTGIPDKGRALTQLSGFWFDHFRMPHHLVSLDPAEFGLPDDVDVEPLVGRTMLVRKTEVVPVECVVRGYLTGSGWKEYCRNGEVCGVNLPVGLQESAKLPEPIFTPATKAEQGEHDENISFERMVGIVGAELAEDLRERSLKIYQEGAQYAADKGIIVADTKFEFGRVDGEVLLIDEVLTPDSSRFWPADQYAPGRGQPAFDKQFVRDWLSETGWDKNSPPPPLPAHVVAKTREKYIEAYERITGQAFAWS